MPPATLSPHMLRQLTYCKHKYHLQLFLIHLSEFKYIECVVKTFAHIYKRGQGDVVGCNQIFTTWKFEEKNLDCKSQLLIQD